MRSRTVVLHRHDRLRLEEEPVLDERALDARHPLHLAVTLRDDRVVFLVDVDAIAPLVLGGVARGIRRLQHLRDATEVAADGHEADARADRERAVAPDELVLLDALSRPAAT